VAKKAQPRQRSGFRPISHTADVGFRLWGKTVAELFVQGARALYGLMTDRRRLRRQQVMEVELEAMDQEALLVDWLNHLLYLFDTEGFLGKEITITEISSRKLTARLQGERLDPLRHELKTGVKAATYHMLAVQPTAAGWEARIIFDL
jgi:SHS2 domain-containing protein